MLFLTIAKKRELTETANFSVLSVLSVYDHNKDYIKKIGWCRAVLEFRYWQLKNGKTTGRK